MILIAGLGNPGKQFEHTRHNIGFSVLDRFLKEQGFSSWRLEEKFEAEISEGKIGRKKIILAKPQTFMNNSGKAVKLLFENCLPAKALAQAGKLPALGKPKARPGKIENLVVIHDDLDIPLGKIKISQGRGSAGHKGVQSIIDELGSRDFIRLRLGIKNQELRIKSEEDFVLGGFTKEEQKIIRQVKKRACEALEVAIRKGVEKAMGIFNC